MTIGTTLPMPFEVDLVAYDETDRPVLAVEAKAHRIEHPQETLDHLVGLAGAIDYWLLADPEEMRLYGGRSVGSGARPVAVLETKSVLVNYDPQLNGRALSQFYLVALVDAWLRDLALRWKSAEPPGTAELRGTGLLERLTDGSTRREVTIRGDPLR